MASALTGAAMLPTIAAAQTTTPAPVTTAARPVQALSDNIQPQWGHIRVFWGDNTPFWGHTRAFAGYIGASRGHIRGFWGQIGGHSDAPQDYSTLSAMLSVMVSQSEGAFGAAVQAQTGKSFADGFANPLLNRYGISLTNPQSLANLDANTREHFFLAWWDGLMNSSGAATRATWEVNSVYFSSFENTGESNRDFLVPLSTKLAPYGFRRRGSVADHASTGQASRLP